MKNKNSPTKYLTILFILSYLWQLAIYFTGGIESALFPFMMLFPAMVAIGFRIINKEGFRNIGWGLKKWSYIFPALLIPTLVTLSVGFLLISLGWGALSGEHFSIYDGIVEIRTIPFVLGSHSQSIAFFALNFMLSLFFQSLLGSVVTIGEEFGWRAYLQEKFIMKYGINRGLILLGGIWGYWHLPIILMGYNFPNSPVLGALIWMPISTIFGGIFLGWLYLRSRSIWMPTLAHAAMNLTGTLLLTEVNMLRDDLYLQLLYIASWGIVAFGCLVSLNLRETTLWQTAREPSTITNKPADALPALD